MTHINSFTTMTNRVEFRCFECGRLLCKANDEGLLHCEIKCMKCKELRVI